MSALWRWGESNPRPAAATSMPATCLVPSKRLCRHCFLGLGTHPCGSNAPARWIAPSPGGQQEKAPPCPSAPPSAPMEASGRGNGQLPCLAGIKLPWRSYKRHLQVSRVRFNERDTPRPACRHALHRPSTATSPPSLKEPFPGWL